MVGIDGSAASSAAAVWAAGEAQLRGSELHLVVVDDPVFLDYAEETAAQVASLCRSAHPYLDIVEETVAGDPANILARRSEKADLVVVGGGSASRLRFLGGSVRRSLLRTSSCPVVVVGGKTAGDEAGAVEASHALRGDPADPVAAAPPRP